MGNLSAMGPEAFAEDHHKKGYKEIGWAQAKIAIQKGSHCITEPYEYKDFSPYGSDADGEYILWKRNRPIAEFKHLSHAMALLTILELEESEKKRHVK